MSETDQPDINGPNSWLIDEYRKVYESDPAAVPETWRQLFESDNGAAPAKTQPVVAEPVAPEKPTVPALSARTPALPTISLSPPKPEPAPAPAPAPAPDEPGEPLRGVKAAIVSNMETSLSVPTATSFRELPAKLLEVNRTILNNHRRRVRGEKVSFTHILGFAIIQAIKDAAPNLANTFATDSAGKPRLVRNDHIHLGLAVDKANDDGSRSLVVPVIENARDMDFSAFVDAYQAQVDKALNGKLTIDDMTGANITITNPGTIGTVQSVPRLMAGQSVIVGLGAIGYPAEYQAADPKLITQLGISKIISVTSTYDHRIIQGAESGLFLQRLHELIIGQDNFYDDLFRSTGVPYVAVEWNIDRGTADNHDSIEGAVAKQMAVNTVINQYRVRGHLIANTNPLSDGKINENRELDPATYGLTIWDLDREYLTGVDSDVYKPVSGKPGTLALRQILGILRDAYARSIGIEYMHITDHDEKRWIQEEVENDDRTLDHETRGRLLEKLNVAEAFEKFLASRYVGQKRFGLEGGESAIPILDAILSHAADGGLERAVMGMAHRGRLNVLVNIMGKDKHTLFSEFEGTLDEQSTQGSGDVKYHLGLKGTHEAPSKNTISVELAPNPSHLEAVDPVVIGMARSYWDQMDTSDRTETIVSPNTGEESTRFKFPVLPILIHGDAAFAGQGVVAESLNFSQVPGYRVGGTIHLIINNQLGYTTAPHQSRTATYSTDVAKTVQAPIIHVNADDPEACLRVAKLAFDFRQRFQKDVVIDMIGYRRFGHNEGDDPSYTQPAMYRKIKERLSVRELYTETLRASGEISLEEADEVTKQFEDLLQLALKETREAASEITRPAMPASPTSGIIPRVDSSVPRKMLDYLYRVLSTTPESFTVHPKLARQFERRDKMWEQGEVDWALAEAFAIGSLMDGGTSVRLSGQDSQRGTFAHRHAVLHDYLVDPTLLAPEDEHLATYTPLSGLDTDSSLWVYDSTLSEYAGLGFEYGYNIAQPNTLVMWEAQFGDFVNGSQIIIDQYLVAAKDKWNLDCGVVMLLPHGYEGQGPEHSSGRMERFLTLCAKDNIQVANVSTAAQYFHLLRRQMLVPVRKPLVIFAPKSGLRSRTTRSRVEDFTTGTFEPLLDDPAITDPSQITRVVFASGKVAHEAMAYRDETYDSSTAIVRIEQLYPLPMDEMLRVCQRYENHTDRVWLQEEPENMGAWNAVKVWTDKHGRLNQLGSGKGLRLVSRHESGSPATGSAAIHRDEQADLMTRTFSPTRKRN